MILMSLCYGPIGLELLLNGEGLEFLWELFRAGKGLVIWVEGTGYYGNIGKALLGLL